MLHANLRTGKLHSCRITARTLCKLLQYLLQNLPHLLTSLCRLTETSDTGKTLQHLKDKAFIGFYRIMGKHINVAPHLHQNKKRLEDSSRFLFDNALHFVRLIANRSMRILFCNALPFNHQTETKYRYYYQRNI